MEDSTTLARDLGAEYAHALRDYRVLIREACLAAGGREQDAQGDAVFFVFARAHDAVAGAVAAQRSLAAGAWPGGKTVRARMGLHTGEMELAREVYVGLDIHLAARVAGMAHGGQVLVSDVTRTLVQHDLPTGVDLRDLGLHRLKDFATPERIHQLIIAGLPADFRPLRSQVALAHNLPAQVTSFVGRERQVAEARQMIETRRLVTLTGVGGAGKTRLALRVASDVLEEFPDGVWFVELAPLADPALVPQALASTLGLGEHPGRSLEATLAEYLRSRQVLVVLDNCEHVIAASAALVEPLLTGSPKLRVLATSREALGVSGEVILPVPSLSVPADHRLPPVEALATFEAVRLFVHRASAAAPEFRLTEANAPAVVQVCRRLDGLPLAIELAAARVKVLSVEQIAARLDDRFRLLTGGSRTALPRHQTLQAAMDWSYDLLSEEERVLLRRLSVCSGGFTLEAAEMISSDGALGAPEVLDVLTHLVDKSLVLVDEDEGQKRYRMLETVRQYGRDKLWQSGESERLRTRHREWFLALAEQAEPELRGPDQAAWLTRLDVEHKNLRAALEWSKQEPGSGEACLRLTGALWWFWNIRSHWSEARSWLEGALAHAGSTPGPARIKVMQAAGFLAYGQDDYARAVALGEESLARCRASGDVHGVAVSFNLLGLVAWGQGDTGYAATLFTQSLALFKETRDPGGIARSLYDLGNVAGAQGDYARAEAMYTESLSLARNLGDARIIADSLNNLGHVVHQQGDAERAARLLQESLSLARMLGYRQGIARGLFRLGLVERRRGQLDRAVELLEESLGLFRDSGDRGSAAFTLATLGTLAQARGEYDLAAARLKESLHQLKELGQRGSIAKALEGLAALHMARGAAERCARLLGAAEALRESIRTSVPAAERDDYERSLADARTALGDEAFAAARAAGRTLTTEQAIDFALREPAGPTAAR